MDEVGNSSEDFDRSFLDLLRGIKTEVSKLQIFCERCKIRGDAEGSFSVFSQEIDEHVGRTAQSKSDFSNLQTLIKDIEERSKIRPPRRKEQREEQIEDLLALTARQYVESSAKIFAMNFLRKKQIKDQFLGLEQRLKRLLPAAVQGGIFQWRNSTRGSRGRRT